jgi:hypothetical protein
MLWEGKPLREITADDVHKLVESGLQEHLQLEYKSTLYEHNDAGKREFLLDICMFANSSGGILLIGIPERRDEQQKPTGEPDAAGVLGVEVENSEALLLAYDARVTEAIEERLPLESASIEVGEGRKVLAIRIPNSNGKPHSVRHQGHIYFPSRRERHRYPMSVREIKEMVMRTASRLQQAEELLENAFLSVRRTSDAPYLAMGMIPVFFEDFLVDVRSQSVFNAVAHCNRVGAPEHSNPVFTFEGLERRNDLWEHTVRFCRNGLLYASLQLARPARGMAEDAKYTFNPTSIDLLLRAFVTRAKTIYEAAALSAPCLLSMMMRIERPLVAHYPALYNPWQEDSNPIQREDYPFPYLQIADLSNTDRIIRPLCDQAHQTFGKRGSPRFDGNGVWIDRGD